MVGVIYQYRVANIIKKSNSFKTFHQKYVFWLFFEFLKKMQHSDWNFNNNENYFEINYIFYIKKIIILKYRK